jgi:hypothetical protein
MLRAALAQILMCVPVLMRGVRAEEVRSFFTVKKDSEWGPALAAPSSPTDSPCLTLPLALYLSQPEAVDVDLRR